MMMMVVFCLLSLLISILFMKGGVSGVLMQNMMFLLGSCLVLSKTLGFWTGIYMIYGLDWMSWTMLLLTLWISGLMFMSVSGMISPLMKVLFLSLTISLVLGFSVMSTMVFYIFFELSLIPIFLLILGWGVSIDRFMAGMYMLIYTVVVSLPLMLVLISIKIENLTMMYDYFSLNNLSLGGCIYMIMIMAFLVKMPMYLVHVWLPKAHVEAPVYGSMVLAGVLLKLGGYGLMRFMVMALKDAMGFNIYIISVSVVGAILMSVVCLVQSDMKMLVAYSSVVHMGMLMGGMMTMFKSGFMGGLYMMVAHGLCSSGLFYLVNLNYKRFGSRMFFLNKGGLSVMPSLGLWWFLMCSSNLSAPLSLNLIGEVMLINSMIMWSGVMIMYSGLICFLSASYSLYLYGSVQHGQFNFLSVSFNSGEVKEFLVLVLHWVPLNLVILNLSIF